MRVLLGALFLVAISSISRAEVPKLPRETTCEEDCQIDRSVADSSCDAHPQAEADRTFCHELTRARLDVCLRICED